MDWPLVGHAREMELGRQSLSAGNGLMVVGAAGVGKSRLVRELLDHCACGRPTTWIAASEATRTVPFAAFLGLLPEEPTRDRLEFVQAILRAVEELGPRPIVVVDDAHLLDEGALAATWSLVTTSTATVVVTARREEPLPATLVELWKDGHLGRVDLEPLDRQDTDELRAEALGPVDTELGEQLWRLSQGTPLYLRELVETSVEQGTIASDGSTWTGDLSSLPESARLADLVERRLGALDDRQRTAFDAIALASPLPRSIVEHLAGDRALGALESLQLVTEHPEGVVQPAHPLHGEIDRAGMHPARRRELLGQLVAAPRATGFPDPADRLRAALWQQDSGHVDDPDLAIGGGAAALARHDATTAEQLARSLLEIHPGSVQSVLLARALSVQGRHEEAEATLAGIEGSIESEIVDVAVTRAQNLSFGLHRLGDARQVLDDVATRVSERAALGTLDAERARLAAFAGDFGATQRVCRSVLANSSSPATSRASAHVDLTLARAMLGDVSGPLEGFEEALQEIRACGSEPALAEDQLHLSFVSALRGAGRLAEADAVTSERAAATARSEGLPIWLSMRAVTLELMGRLDEARGVIDASVEAHSELDPFGVRPQAFAVAALIAGQQGDAERADEASATAKELAPAEPRLQVWVQRGRVWAAAAAGDPGGGAEIAAREAPAIISGDHVLWGIWLLLDAVRLGRPDLVLDDLRSAVSRTRGATLQQWGLRHAEALASMNAEELLVVARGYASFGALLLAAETAAQASALAEDHDRSTAARAAARSAAWQRHCPTATTPALRRRADGPSERELTVALAAAEGLTSRQVADQLHLSVRTVDNHLRSVYRCLHLGGRDELTFLVEPETDLQPASYT